jgi:hypothetical protein
MHWLLLSSLPGKFEPRYLGCHAKRSFSTTAGEHVLYLPIALAQEMFGGGEDRCIVTFDFDLATQSASTDSPVAVRTLDFGISILNTSSESTSAFSIAGKTKRASAFDDAEAKACPIRQLPCAAGDNQHPIGADLDVAAGPHGEKDEHDKNFRGHWLSNRLQTPSHFSATAVLARC